MAQRPLTPNRRGSAPRLSVRATQDLIDALDHLAAVEDRRRSEVLRDALDLGVRARLDAATTAAALDVGQQRPSAGLGR